MKKWILLSGLLVLGFMSRASAGIQTPLDAQGHELQTIDWVGAIPCNIDVSTNTNAVLCGSAGRGVVYGVIVSSPGANTDFLVLRDSNTANATSSTATIVFANGTAANGTGAATTLTVKFPVPMRFLNGIDAVVPAGAAGRTVWTILYRPMTATE